MTSTRKIEKAGEITHGTTWWRRRLANLDRLGDANGGNSAIEFALAAPMLLALLVPVADLGMAFAQQLQVQQAAVRVQ